ncbi:MAG: ShlB/FhaC/HecB family hemolysin secretion/activation protein [Puniceicoccaceae bacterium]|nr:MAG: ShlB/FhaC/HecB family hemolysin secretion/activation protein [Puniceicoccaceae bacterium]
MLVLALPVLLLLTSLNGQTGGLGRVYPVSEFNFSFGFEHPDLPELAPVRELEVGFGEERGVLVRAEPGEATVRFRIGAVPEGSRFAESALEEVRDRVIRDLNERGFYGVFMTPSSEAIDPATGRDRRPREETALEMVIWLPEVKLIRTVARGTRIPVDRAINHPAHARVLRYSPLRAADEDRPGSLLMRRPLDSFLEHLNRHPARRIDIALSSSGEPGGIVLDYLVNERRPIVVYGQLSNTGTGATGEWRQRLGATHYQLTGRDDILSVDFLTASLDQSNSVLASYELPVLYPNRLRARVFGSWGEYRAEEIGVALLDFEGTTLTAGVQARGHLFRPLGFYLQGVAGVRWERVEVTNVTFEQTGQTNLIIPSVGLEADRQTNLLGFKLNLSLEGNVSSIDERTRPNLGRLETDPTWLVLKFRSENRLFLEPLLFRGRFRDESTWRTSTLAHEIALDVRGQASVAGDRVIPQQQFLAGGFFSVRGYPESVSAGDHGAVVNAEYRFHLPRALKPYGAFAAAGETPPERFMGRYRARPPRVYGLPDWDLIFRGFVDAGITRNERRRADESDHTLVSAGVGVELQLLGNLNLRVDYGHVLRTLERNSLPIANAEKGDSRIHFITTLSW